MGSGAGFIFVAGVVAVGAWAYTQASVSTVVTRVDQSATFRQLAGLGATPPGEGDMLGVSDSGFSVSKSSNAKDKTITWKYAYKGSTLGTYRANVGLKSDGMTVIKFDWEDFQPKVKKGDELRDQDYDTMRDVARAITHEQARASLEFRKPDRKVFADARLQLITRGAAFGVIANEIKNMDSTETRWAKARWSKGSVDDNDSSYDYSAPETRLRP